MRPRSTLLALVAGVLLLLGVAAPARATVAAIPGDYPDPTVVQVGGQYVATATSDRWEPALPLMTSPDLRTWRQVGSVFPRVPSWASGNRVWAPELTAIPGGLLLTYSGLKRSGQWCIGAATAPGPGGPWTDHGPKLCPANGVIDSWVTVDPATPGSAYLLYKAKGIGGAIYGTGFDLRSLEPVGSPTELVRPENGDKGVTEGPALVQRDGWWYLLFSTGNCCKPPCTYVERVARSRSPLGPYDRRRTALLTNDGSWRCLGHGTPVLAPDGGLALLHHAYPAGDPLELRRWAVLTRLGWDPDDGTRPGAAAPTTTTAPTTPTTPVTPATATETATTPAPAPAPAPDPALAGRAWPEPIGADDGAPGPTGQPIADDFTTSRLSPAWQWPARASRPAVSQADGRLQLGCGAAGLIARQVVGTNYDLAVSIDPERSGAPVVGLRDRAGVQRGVEVRDGRARAVRRSATKALGAGPAVRLPAGRPVRVRLSLRPGGVLSASVAAGGVERKLTMGVARTGGAPVRVALSCSGTGTARFAGLRLQGAYAPPATMPADPPTVGATIVAAAARAGLL